MVRYWLYAAVLCGVSKCPSWLVYLAVAIVEGIYAVLVYFVGSDDVSVLDPKRGWGLAFCTVNSLPSPFSHWFQTLRCLRSMLLSQLRRRWRPRRSRSRSSSASRSASRSRLSTQAGFEISIADETEGVGWRWVAHTYGRRVRLARNAPPRKLGRARRLERSIVSSCLLCYPHPTLA